MDTDVSEAKGMIRTLASITEDDENFITKVILLSGAEYVLEFGCGISTLVISKLTRVVSYETKNSFAQALLKEHPQLDVRIWDGQHFDEKLFPPENHGFDVAFVDGPAHGMNREHSTRIASECAYIVIIHDAQREYEKMWQDKYLKPRFHLIDSNEMCNCWITK